MGKQNGAKAKKRRANAIAAAARTSNAWTKDFWRENRENDKPDKSSNI